MQREGWLYRWNHQSNNPTLLIKEAPLSQMQYIGLLPNGSGPLSTSTLAHSSLAAYSNKFHSALLLCLHLSILCFIRYKNQEEQTQPVTSILLYFPLSIYKCWPQTWMWEWFSSLLKKLRWNSHNIELIILKCTTQWYLVYYKIMQISMLFSSIILSSLKNIPHTH